MSESAKKESTFARAEAGTRHVILMVGAGVVAYVVGSVIMSSVTSALSEHFERVESPTTALIVYWVLSRFWLLVVLPGFTFLGGRFLQVSAELFAATAVFAGEMFDLLLSTARLGVEGTFTGVEDTLARLLTLVLGLAVALLAARRGRAGAEAAAANASLKAEAAKKEYAEMLKRAEQSGAATPAEAPKPAENPAPPPDETKGSGG